MQRSKWMSDAGYASGERAERELKKLQRRSERLAMKYQDVFDTCAAWLVVGGVLGLVALGIGWLVQWSGVEKSIGLRGWQSAGAMNALLLGAVVVCLVIGICVGVRAMLSRGRTQVTR